METNKLQWKRIAEGDRLPCDSLLMKKDGTISSLVSCAGVKVGQDAYYLPVEGLRTLPKKEESEEEKIRKALIKIVNGIYQDNVDYAYVEDGITYEQLLAYLKKQSEKEKFIKKQLEYIKGCRDTIRRWHELGKKGKKWKPSDEQMQVLEFISDYHAFANKNNQDIFNGFVKQLKKLSEE